MTHPRLMCHSVGLTGLCDGSTSVAPCTHKAIHKARAALAHERHHPAGQSAGLLAPDREDDQHNLGGQEKGAWVVQGQDTDGRWVVGQDLETS
jgi:hypothetical protein